MRLILLIALTVVAIGVRGATLEYVSPDELNTAIQGVESIPGPIGERGVQGVRGDDGLQGPPGVDGTTPDLQPILDRIDVLETLHAVALPPDPIPPPPSGDTFVLLDFEDTVLHDKAWLLSQPKDTVGIIVQPKKDSGVDRLTLAVGEGRNGGNALLVESLDSGDGLPGFWVAKYRNAGTYGANFKDDRGYLLPRGQRANRLEFWMRFQPGFREAYSAKTPRAYPNHQNMHVGTYHFDPDNIATAEKVVESDNWHFYFQIFARHDLAQGEWIRVVLNQWPQSQRSTSSDPGNNPTKAKGNFWELLTRFYIDNYWYFASPQIAYPVKMWIDDIKLTYVEEGAPTPVGPAPAVSLSDSNIEKRWRPEQGPFDGVVP